MHFNEFDKILHDIREQIAEEEKAFTSEECVERNNRIGDAFAKELGLKTVPTREEQLTSN